MRRFYFAALAALLIASVAIAANKVATLVPPADYTSGGWQIILSGNAEPGSTSTLWCATTSFTARDAATGARDPVSHTVCTPTPPGDITTFINARLAAARTANGY